MQHKRLEDRADPARLPAPAADPSPLLGSWVNVDPATRQICRLRVDWSDDALWLNVYGSGDTDPEPWGRTRARCFATAPTEAEAVGFTASYDFGFMETQLCSNEKFGVLVIQSYSRFKDDSGRGDYFSREFFRRGPALGDTCTAEPAIGTGGERVRDDAVRHGSGWVDLGAWLGRWVNAREDTECIRGFVLRREADRFLLGVEPRGGDSWGEVAVSACAANVDNGEGVAFYAEFDLGLVVHRLAANVNKGLIVIAAFSHYKDADGRHDHLTREFFYRQLPAEQ